MIKIISMKSKPILFSFYILYMRHGGYIIKWVNEGEIDCALFSDGYFSRKKGSVGPKFRDFS